MNFLDSCFPLIAKKNLTGKLTEVRAGAATYLVVKNADGYYAYPQKCPHRGTDLRFATVQDAGVQCPYHGWKIQTDGKVEHPYGEKVNCSVAVVKLEEHFDCLWMNRNKLPLPLSPSAHVTFTGAQSIKLSAPFHVVLDNFNEGSHTAFVHRVMGSKESQVKEIDFSWEDRGDHVHVKYLGPQRPNLVYNGPFWKTYLNWDIHWETYVDPVRMVYHSKWVTRRTGRKWWLENENVYFLVPCGKEQTWLHAFTYTEIPRHLRPFSFLIKLFSNALTRNQIVEDEKFYPAISDLPFSFRGLRLDKFDHPLVAIRKKVDPSYFVGFGEDE